MSDTSAQQEPSIEEILASIRRIISEDGDAEGGAAEGAEPAAADAAPAAPVPAPVEEPAVAAPAALAADEPDDDILELTERVDEPAPPVEAAAPPPRRQPIQEPETRMPAPKSDYDDNALVSEQTAQKTTDVFSRLTPQESDSTDDPLPISTRTLEEVVRGMLRPMLREWLDTYLPGIVERSVERELRRMSRRAEDMH